MAVKRCEANINVVKAAEIRIKNVFGNGLPVFFSFSGGKDSLCVAQLMVKKKKTNKTKRDRYEAAYSAVHR